MTAKVAANKWNNEDIMKTIIRTTCAALAVAALCGCGVPKEEHQKVQDELAAANSKLARATQDIQALKGALDQRDSEVANMSQQFQQQKAAYELVIKRQGAELAKGKSTAAPKAAAPKGSAPAGKSKAPAKKAAH